ncbi:Sulfotransferase family protein [Mucilaginibacter mallensis]|uniref:Sulfotransferase family protein n=1 Tax=Mucilaginibacter mallensis TaxID=652787 RepID=A0A1H1ZEE7_MUCMA|nr:sulfotransferase [Mucilaginibacter mallensis]SDT31917.1 Sulfotransferase family protein [Mucilaginibacter mallensis]
MSNSTQPLGIQIIGTQRSGSNLLRVMLDQSSEIVSPHPAHVLVTFVPLLELYGDLDTETYKVLINDVVDYVEANPVPWDGITIDRDWIFENSNVYSLFEINRLIYEQAAICKKAKYWCCKSMANVHYADELESHSPNLKYIYLYRDGRDVAVSFKKAIVGEKHIYHLARQWKYDQEACIELADRIEKDRFFALNYETLIAQPEAVIKDLCSFLDITYNENMLSFYNSHESKATAAAGEMWQNLEKPIMRNNTGKFHKELTHEEIEIFELVNQNVLQKLDYPLFTALTNTQLISEDAIEQYGMDNKILKKEILVKARKSDLEHREPQLIILRKIKERAAELVIQSSAGL